MKKETNILILIGKIYRNKTNIKKAYYYFIFAYNIKKFLEI